LKQAKFIVKDQVTDYPVGTFAGYTIETPSLLNVGALNAMTRIFNGVLQESKSGNGPLVGLGTDLLIGSSKQHWFSQQKF
jgi:hypothetical protein